MNGQDVERKMTSILRILADQTGPTGSRFISRELQARGLDLTERGVRYHLKIMDERGLTESCGKEGRVITRTGLQELQDALVQDKIGLVIGKIEALSYRTSFNSDDGTGQVILNTTLLPKDALWDAVVAMKDVFAAQLCVSDLVGIAYEGESLGEVVVPKGRVAFGTVCSITINSVLLKAGIPVDSRFGGILQVHCSRPTRFTDLITYAGSTLDPLEVFIRSKMTSVREAATKGEGKILASFREVPAVCRSSIEEVVGKLRRVGIHGLITLGRPGQPVLQVPVTANRVGMVVVGGLNPMAAVEEAGIATDNQAMSAIVDFRQLCNYWKLYDQLRLQAG